MSRIGNYIRAFTEHTIKKGKHYATPLQLPTMTLRDSVANTSATFTMQGDKVVITFN